MTENGKQYSKRHTACTGHNRHQSENENNNREILLYLGKRKRKPERRLDTLNTKENFLCVCISYILL